MLVLAKGNSMAKTISEEPKKNKTLSEIVLALAKQEYSVKEVLDSLESADLGLKANFDIGIMSYSAVAHLSNADFRFGINDFIHLHRCIYEYENLWGVLPTLDIGMLCIEAAQKLKFPSGLYSFHNALAYRFEIMGKTNEAELHIRSAESIAASYPPFDEMKTSLLKMGLHTTVSFLEANISDEPIDKHFKQYADSAIDTIKKIAKTHKRNNPEIEYIGWRWLAFEQCYFGGDINGALKSIAKAINCGKNFLEPLPMTILLGDRLWVAAHTKKRSLIDLATEELLTSIDQLPNSMAHYAILERTIKLCKEKGSKSISSLFSYVLDKL